MNEPLLCPFCGSIENNGTLCGWCHSEITDTYYESEETSNGIEI